MRLPGFRALIFGLLISALGGCSSDSNESENLSPNGATGEDLEPLFKSAERCLRMWEKSEHRGAALSGGARP